MFVDLARPEALSKPTPNPLIENLVTRSLRRRRADLFKLSASNRRSTFVSPRTARTQRLFLGSRQDDAVIAAGDEERSRHQDNHLESLKRQQLQRLTSSRSSERSEIGTGLFHILT
jgi:hypothetical protein